MAFQTLRTIPPSTGNIEPENGATQQRGTAVTDFSLVVGGPLYQFLLKTGLVRPPMARVSRRIFAFIGVTWCPLLLLSAFSGELFQGAGIPFFSDIDVHVRLLFCLPLLLEAEIIVHNRIRLILNQFLDHGIVLADDRPAFDKIEARVMRLRNSWLVELTLILLAFIGGNWIWNQFAMLRTTTWYAVHGGVGPQLTPAGWWYAFVSLPIIRFLLLRWYFRFALWYLVLWRISRLNLKINVLHPDKAGGLGFLGASSDALSAILVAQSSFVSGVIANRIINQGAKLIEFKAEIALVAALLLLMANLPLFFFLPALAQAKRSALPRISGLAARYAREFQQKWCDAPAPISDVLLGSPDIQSLADLDTGFSMAKDMGLLPFNKAQTVRGLIVILLPFAPLLLTVIPFEELIGRLVGLVL